MISLILATVAMTTMFWAALETVFSSVVFGGWAVMTVLSFGEEVVAQYLPVVVPVVVQCLWYLWYLPVVVWFASKCVMFVCRFVCQFLLLLVNLMAWKGFVGMAAEAVLMSAADKIVTVFELFGLIPKWTGPRWNVSFANPGSWLIMSEVMLSQQASSYVFLGLYQVNHRKVPRKGGGGPLFVWTLVREVATMIGLGATAVATVIGFLTTAATMIGFIATAVVTIIEFGATAVVTIIEFGATAVVTMIEAGKQCVCYSVFLSAQFRERATTMIGAAGQLVHLTPRLCELLVVSLVQVRDTIFWFAHSCGLLAVRLLQLHKTVSWLTWLCELLVVSVVCLFYAIFWLAQSCGLLVLPYMRKAVCWMAQLRELLVVRFSHNKFTFQRKTKLMSKAQDVIVVETDWEETKALRVPPPVFKNAPVLFPFDMPRPSVGPKPDGQKRVNFAKSVDFTGVHQFTLPRRVAIANIPLTKNREKRVTFAKSVDFTGVHQFTLPRQVAIANIPLTKNRRVATTRPIGTIRLVGAVRKDRRYWAMKSYSASTSNPVSGSKKRPASGESLAKSKSARVDDYDILAAVLWAEQREKAKEFARGVTFL